MSIYLDPTATPDEALTMDMDNKQVLKERSKRFRRLLDGLKNACDNYLIGLLTREETASAIIEMAVELQETAYKCRIAELVLMLERERS